MAKVVAGLAPCDAQLRPHRTKASGGSGPIQSLVDTTLLAYGRGAGTKRVAEDA